MDWTEADDKLGNGCPLCDSNSFNVVELDRYGVTMEAYGGMLEPGDYDFQEIVRVELVTCCGCHKDLYTSDEGWAWLNLHLARMEAEVV